MSKNILVIAVIVAGVLIYVTGERVPISPPTPALVATTILPAGSVLPSAGVVLPVRWGDLGKQLVSTGVIDGEKFEQLYASRGGLTAEMKKMLSGEDNDNVKITTENSGVILNLLWALGLGSKNEILEKGPMIDKNYGGAANFASTGGWTLAKGDAMDHYSQHQFFNLTPAQQALVDKVSRGIYRPCCGNSTYFPDCNHGMAMLGLLELMASQGVSEQDMYKAALAVNSYWFPDNYATIAKYLGSKGLSIERADPKEILGINYSSGQGYAKIASQVNPVDDPHGGSGCGVDAGAPVAPQRQQSGCGVDAGPSVAVPKRQSSGCGI